MIYIYYTYMSYGYPVTQAVYYNKPVRNRLERFIALRYIVKDILRFSSMTSTMVKITNIVDQTGSVWSNPKADDMMCQSNSLEREVLI